MLRHYTRRVEAYRTRIFAMAVIREGFVTYVDYIRNLVDGFLVINIAVFRGKLAGSGANTASTLQGGGALEDIKYPSHYISMYISFISEIMDFCYNRCK